MKVSLKRSAIWLIAMIGLATGCLEREFRTDGLILEVDRETLSILPEAPLSNPDAQYDSIVLDTVTVISNRSWSATIVGQNADWVSLRTEEFLNLAENERKIPVVLECERNFTQEARRATLMITTPDGSLMVPLVQQGAQYRLDAAVTRSELVAMLDTTVLKVRCNTDWQISLLNSSDASFVSFSAMKGSDNEDVKVMLGENTDMENPREVQIKLSAKDCEDRIVSISQMKASPYAKFKMDPIEMPIEVDSYTFPFSVNVPWTAEVNGNFKMAGISPSSGGPTSGGMMKLTFQAGGDPGVFKKGTITIHPEGGEDEVFPISQQGCIHLDFMDFVSQAEDATYDGTNKAYRFKWPFAYPTQSSFGGSYSSCVSDPATYPYVTTDPDHPVLTSFYTKVGFYEFQVLCRITSNSSGTLTGGIWINTVKQGFQIGSTRFDYIAIPAIKGMKLVKVIYEPTWLLSISVAIREHDLNRLNPGTRPTDIVPGGEMWKSGGGSSKKVTAELMDNHTFELTDTEPNTSYRISFEASPTTSSGLKDLILIYEPVE